MLIILLGYAQESAVLSTTSCSFMPPFPVCTAIPHILDRRTRQNAPHAFFVAQEQEMSRFMFIFAFEKGRTGRSLN